MLTAVYSLFHITSWSSSQTPTTTPCLHWLFTCWIFTITAASHPSHSSTLSWVKEEVLLYDTGNSSSYTWQCTGQQFRATRSLDSSVLRVVFHSSNTSNRITKCSLLWRWPSVCNGKSTPLRGSGQAVLPLRYTPHRLVLLISGQLPFGQSEHTLTTHTCNVQHAHRAPAALSKSREINTAWTFRITSRSLPCLCAVCECIGCACFYWCMEHAKSQPSPHSTRLSVFVSDEKQVVGVETVCHCSLSYSPSSIGNFSTNCKEAMIHFSHIITFLTENVTSFLLDIFDTVHSVL